MALRFVTRGLRGLGRQEKRWCSEKEYPKVHPVGNDTLENPLAADELRMHQDAERKWMEFSNQIIEARKAGEDERLKVIDEGLELSSSLGPDLRRPGYDSALNLEAASVFKGRGDIESACARCEAAEEAYKLDKDVAGTMEAKLQRAYFQLDLQRFEEAEEAFQSIVRWTETDARRATPMAQSIAEQLQHTARLGLAMAKTELGQHEAAHEILGVVLPHFANACDVDNTWSCLATAEKCFRGLNDMKSVKKAVERQVSWAKRFKLEDKLTSSQKKLSDL